VAEQLECVPYLERARALAEGATWSQRQLVLAEQTGDLVEVVRQLTSQSRLSPLPAGTSENLR
jgi:hypothetical protein